MFRNYRLDSRDKKYLIALAQPNGICPECFRPYLNNDIDTEHATDRYYRRIVVLETISFWVFMIAMWLPLVLIIAIPAAWVKFKNLFDHFSGIDIIDRPETRYKMPLVRDDHYTRYAEEVIDDKGSTLDQFVEETEKRHNDLTQRLTAIENKLGTVFSIYFSVKLQNKNAMIKIINSNGRT